MLQFTAIVPKAFHIVIANVNIDSKALPLRKMNASIIHIIHLNVRLIAFAFLSTLDKSEMNSTHVLRQTVYLRFI